MRPIQFITFFSIVIFIYSLINYYIFTHGYSATPEQYRPYFTVIFILLASSFLGGRILERFWIPEVSHTMTHVGSFWLAAMVYFLFAVFFIDVARGLNHFFHFFPAAFYHNYEQTKLYTSISTIAIVALTVLAGHVNAINPRIKNLSITINKPLVTPLRIVALSDIHLGTVIGKQRLTHIVEKINSLDADIVLLAGDQVDEDIAPVIRQNLGETLRNIKSKYGVFGVTGNHEYIGGVDKAYSYLVEHGITMLRDEVVHVNGVCIIGREDISSRGFANKQRKPLKELLHNADASLPLILLDHQPFNLNDAVENGIDLQLSGHTHNGQMFPFNYITKKVYELDWGYKQKGDTHFYVSCGVGTWGPPVRIGNTPEIMCITLQGTSK